MEMGMEGSTLVSEETQLGIFRKEVKDTKKT
jgi:hypothetical protein